MTTDEGVAKITISIPRDLEAAARRAVRHGRAASVSAYVVEALRQRETREALLADIEETLDMTGGPTTDEERAWADRALGH